MEEGGASAGGGSGRGLRRGGAWAGLGGKVPTHLRPHHPPHTQPDAGLLRFFSA